MAIMYEVHRRARILIHTDLANGANSMRKRIEAMEETNDREGIYFVKMSSLIFSAFAIEAKVNFVGFTLLGSDWPERKSLKDKIKRLGKPWD